MTSFPSEAVDDVVGIGDTVGTVDYFVAGCSSNVGHVRSPEPRRSFGGGLLLATWLRENPAAVGATPVAGTF